MSDFHGYPTGILENVHLRLEYLLHAGPRLVRLMLPKADENLLGECPETGWDQGPGRVQLFGGHRLWAAPEEPGVSYLPDAEGLQVDDRGTEVELVWAPATENGLGKRLRVSLLADRPGLHLTQTITNHFDHAVHMAPWGITILPLGGEALLPSSPGLRGLQPDRQLVVWPYSDWHDPRLQLHPGGVVVKGESGWPPLKLGTFVENGVCAYSRQDVLLVKHFSVPEGDYPDMGCNVEVYCADDYLELETLAPLSDLGPGKSASLNETWEIHIGDAAAQAREEIFPLGAVPAE